MATVTGMTATAVQEVVDDAITDAEVDVSGDLILTKNGGGTVNAGNVIGPQGIIGLTGPGAGPAGGSTGQILQKASGTDHDFVWSNFWRTMAYSAKTVNYTLALGDAEAMVFAGHATTPITVTIPTNATVAFPIGTRVKIVQTGAAEVNVVSAVGVTLSYPPTLVPTLLGIGAVVEVIKIATNTWVLDGHGNVATTELGFQAWDDGAVAATTTWPDFGTGSVKKGYYMETSKGLIIGGATRRWGSGGSQGVGIYEFLLPEDPQNYEPNGYTPIGMCSVGMSAGFGIHKNGVLHCTPDHTDRGVVAIDDGLFLSNTDPSTGTYGNRANFHWTFSYEKA